MSRYRVVIKRATSPDGKNSAEAKSAVFTSGNGETTVSQSATVEVSSSRSFSRSSSSSSASSSSSSN